MRRPRGLLGSVLTLATACEAPPSMEVDTLDDGVPALFSSFEAPKQDLASLVVSFEQAVTDAVPLDASMEERTFSLADPLGPDALGGAVAPPDVDPDKQVRVVVFKRGRQPFDAVVDTVLEPNQVCIEGDSTVWYGRTYLDDPEALRAGGEEVLRSHNEVRKEIWLGRLKVAGGWYDLPKDVRRFTLPDGRRALLARSWQEERLIDEAGNHFAQFFMVELWVEDGEGTVRTAATWVDMYVPFVGPAFAAQLVRNSTEQGLDRQDAFADGDPTFGYCGQDRARAYTRVEDEGG